MYGYISDNNSTLGCLWMCRGTNFYTVCVTSSICQSGTDRPELRFFLGKEHGHSLGD